MARHLFGNSPSDFSVQLVGDQLYVRPEREGTVWTQQTGGAQLTDLLNVDGATPMTTVQSDEDGRLGFYGPDDVTAVWVDFGYGRFLLQATDLGGILGATAASAAAAAASAASALPITGGTLTGALGIRPSGTFDRFNVGTDGTIHFGSGSGAADVDVSRESANVLKVADRLVVNPVASSDVAASMPQAPAGASTTSSPGLFLASAPSTSTSDDGTDSDTTSRLHLYSYQRANVRSYGETIRNFLMRSDSKAMTAWYGPAGLYDATTRAPVGSSWKPWTWTGSHFEANNRASIHGHWEVEVPDSTGALQGRLEIPFIDQTKLSNTISSTTIGVDWTNIRTNLADLSIRAQNITSGDYTGQNTALRIGGNNTVNKDFLLSISSDMQNSGRRWIFRADTTTEAGGNTGTDFRLIRCDDAGGIASTALFIRRSDGQIATGNAGALGARFGIAWSTSGVHGFSAQASGSPGSAAAFDAQLTASTDRVLQSLASGDANRRLVVYTDGKIEWGDGTLSRDTNLYRAAADRLKTDDSLTIGAQLSIGSVAPSGTDSITIDNSSSTANILNLKNSSAGNTGTPNIRSETATAASLVLTSRVTGESASRVSMTTAGQIDWGDGTNSKDVNISRTGAGVLTCSAAFQVTTNLRLNTSSVGGGTGVFGMANASVVPASNPTGGGVLYVEGGALKFRGSSGTVTTIANA